MSTLDDTWRAEAAELDTQVEIGRPGWADRPTGDIPLPAPENLKRVRELTARLWPKEDNDDE